VAGHGDAPFAFATRSDPGQFIRRHRQLSGWTQEELAHRAGVSVRAIRDLEAGRVRRPHGQTIRTLTEALGLTDASRRELDSIIRASRRAAGSTAAGDGLGRPCQLPRDVDDFTGRSESIASVRDHLVTACGDEPVSVPVCAVAGMAGVGKTTLAVHVAHQMRELFHDGQYYVDLRGLSARPLHPAEVLEGFLRTLDIDGAGIPEQVDQRATLWRTRLAGRRVLVVLDDAATEEQVRPVLPGTPGAGVLITSRARLAGLDGAKLIGLDVLPSGEAIQLLGRIAGPERISSQQDATAAVLRFCAGLPLAVRLAGARLAARPHWPVQRLVDLLADEHRRLDELAVGGREVRASVALSYRSLGDREQRVFRLLGLLEATDFTPWKAAALLGTTVTDTGETLEQIVDAQLLQALPSHADHIRYRLHDLVHVFARERLEDRGDGLPGAEADEAGGDRGVPAPLRLGPGEGVRGGKAGLEPPVQGEHQLLGGGVGHRDHGRHQGGHAQGEQGAGEPHELVARPHP
jgi:transcriptional regulator with XRE-family HTH domain